MQKAWKTSSFKVHKLRTHTYQLFFEKDSERNWVLENGPWCFNNILLIIKPWNRELVLSDTLISKIEFWIHICGLPYEWVTLEVGHKVATSFLSWSILQIREFLASHERFFSLKARISVADPMLRRLVISTPFYGDCTAAYQFERLPNFCFACGFLDHTLKGCLAQMNELPRHQTLALPYGTYIHAFGNKGALLSTHLPHQFMDTSTESNGMETPQQSDKSSPKTTPSVDVGPEFNHLQIIPISELPELPISDPTVEVLRQNSQTPHLVLNSSELSSPSQSLPRKKGMMKVPKQRVQRAQLKKVVSVVTSECSPSQKRSADDMPHICPPYLPKKLCVEGLIDVPVSVVVATQPRRNQ